MESSIALGCVPFGERLFQYIPEMVATIVYESQYKHYVDRHCLSPCTDPGIDWDGKTVDDQILNFEKKKEEPATKGDLHAEKICDTDNGEVEEQAELGPPAHHDPRSFGEWSVKIVTIRNSRKCGKVFVETVEQMKCGSNCESYPHRSVLEKAAEQGVGLCPLNHLSGHGNKREYESFVFNPLLPQND